MHAEYIYTKCIPHSVTLVIAFSMNRTAPFNSQWQIRALSFNYGVESQYKQDIKRDVCSLH